MTDILTRLRTLDAGRAHYRLLVLAGIGWMFDAMDTGMVSFVLPVLAQDWNLPPAQLGYIV
ncbi:TPA: MFS transporter, partial [Neisseria bacilliformis]